MPLIPTSQPTVIRIVKKRSTIQSAAAQDTRQGTVLSTTSDINHNVVSAQVLIDGQVEPLDGVSNDTGVKITQGARVVVNFVGGNRFRPHITSFAGGGSANAAASAASVSSALPVTPLSASQSSIPVLLQSESANAPNGFVELPSANVYFDDTAPGVSDSGNVHTNGTRLIAAKPLVMMTLPDPATTILPDSTLIDLVAIGSDGSIVPAGMYRLDKSVPEWVRRDSAGNPYTLPTATPVRLGGVKVGSNLAASGDGTLSAPVMGASGSSHSPGVVPDPGGVAGTTKFLREDGTWNVPGGGSGNFMLPLANGDTPGVGLIGDEYGQPIGVVI